MNTKSKVFMFFSIILLVAAFVIASGGTRASAAHPTNTPKHSAKTSTPTKTPNPDTLSWNALRKNFNIGTLMNECFKAPSANSMTVRCKEILTSEYKGMTLNLDIEWKDLEPTRNKFDFSRLDKYVEFAKANDLTIHLSHLVWARNKESYPTWVFPGATYNSGGGIQSCGTITAGELAAITHNHIKKVVRHLESAVDDNGDPIVVSYNVDNESIDENGNQRKHCFYRKLGPDYAVKLFQYARKFTKARLTLNENFGVGGENFDGGINLTKVNHFFIYVSHLKSLGAPIDAVGIQNHLRNDVDNYFGQAYQDSFESILQKARTAGVKLAITEMDVYQGHKKQDDVASVYKNTFKSCYLDRNCVWFNTWGISDGQSWLRRLHIEDDAQPLLFDEGYQKKSSYTEILNVLLDDSLTPR